MKIRTLLIWLIIIFSIILIIIGWFIPAVLIPSQLSVKSVCFPQEFEVDEERGAIVLGQTTKFANGTIVVEVFDGSQRTLKHENCHLGQFKTLRGNTLQCSTPNLKTLSEIECNLAEYLPLSIYNLIYPDIEKNQSSVSV